MIKSRMKSRILILEKLVARNRPTRMMGRLTKSTAKLARLSFRGRTENCLAKFLNREPKKLTIVRKNRNKRPLKILKWRNLKALMTAPKETANMIR